MERPELANFSLVGGTALSLQYGHRKSVAILGRGKKKDFWDVAELLQHYAVGDFVQYHEEKYASQHLLISVPQALTYFSDAEDTEEPISLKKQTWPKVKKFIQQKVREYLK
jgi:hypothetical protein